MARTIAKAHDQPPSRALLGVNLFATWLEEVERVA